MMRWGFEQRIAMVGGLVLLAATSGCKPWDPDFDPPGLSQLVCTRGSGVEAATMVLVLDTGRSSVTWANGPGAPQGRLTVTDYEYRMDFAAAGQPANVMTINRYDGVMERQVAAKPARRPAQGVREPVAERWICAAQPLKAKV